MTLESAAKHIIQAVCKWIDQSTNYPHLVVNFPGVFIHHCKGILKNTEEFKHYNYITPFKSRNLGFDIIQGQLQYCTIYDAQDKGKMEKFNILIKKEIEEYYSSTEIKDFEYSTPVVEIKIKREQLINLETINNFKF